jgi:hypothetical protein
MPTKSIVHFDYGPERRVKTRKPSKKNVSVVALGVRYAELLRLRRDVELLEGLCHDMGKPKDPRARSESFVR